MRRAAALAILTALASLPLRARLDAARGGQEAAEAREGLELFEKRIRPVLVDRCYECHSAQSEKLKGGLHLDSREGILQGGDLGSVLVPGQPDRSRLLTALRYTDPDLQMPPKGRLPDGVIADFEAWIRMGAPDPRAKAAAAPLRKVGLSIAEGRRFWAYKPPVRPPVPEVKDAAWPAGDIDRFLLAKLEANNLHPAPDAPKAVQLRRLHYDLAGLPPSPEEVDAFVADSSPDAWEKAADRLLASPRFGERWGRHWLDVARFAESLTLRGFIFKEAWRYRDYVIDAFNADVPFDRFIREQVAGDLIEGGSLEERRRRLVALTFLTLGNTNLEEQDKKQLEMDVVDEQLEAIGRAFLAQTIGCARCHDHKFDPIPTRDYYALAGILKNARTLDHDNVSKWLEAPLPMGPAREAEARKHDEAVAALQARVKAARDAQVATRPATESTPDVLALKDVPGIVVDDSQAVKVGEWMHSVHSARYIAAGYLHDKNAGKGEKSLTFQPELVAGRYEVRFAYSHGTSRATNVPVTILSAEGEKVVAVNEQEAPPIDRRYVSLGLFRFENNQGYVMVSNEGTKGHVTADAVVFIPADSPVATTAAPAPGKAAKDSGLVKQLEAELKRLQESGPKRDRAMTVREEKDIRDTRVHIRGSVHTLGEPVARGFLQVALAGAPPALPADRSGRRELAEWLSSPANPLPARVTVNRAWHWLFGAGIVRTTDNFGTTGETPSHPELLDHLALGFIEDGWSLKRLVRRIVRSRAYRMSSAPPTRPVDADPENRLLWRANRRRLDAECIRDTLLAVGGTLSTGPVAGPTYPASLSSDFGYKHTGNQRSVYVPVFRNALPDVFEAFDFADTSVPTGRRDATTVAPQALFFMNHPLVREQARHAAERLLAEKLRDERSRVARAYRVTLGREPREAEAAIALRFLAGAAKPAEAWSGLIHALFASAEFRYVE
jgi:cytochrome c553